MGERTMKGKAVVILSGGVDSTTLLYDVIEQGYDVSAITFDYGQRHRKEIICATRTCKNRGIPHKVFQIPDFRELAYSSLTTDLPVPEGEYTEHNMRTTVVHNRNMILLSLAAAYALNIGATHLFYGAHSGDHTIYPDCRPEFVESLKQAFLLCDWEPLHLHAPYLNWTKGDIVTRGKALGVDYSLTWSCYKGQRKPCGRCGTCLERLTAFEQAGVIDPLDYQ
jgi:7-cyano-7-deazaguanine synthase